MTPDRPVYYRHKQFGNVILVDRIDRDFWLSGRDLASGHYVSAPRSMLVPLTPEEICKGARAGKQPMTRSRLAAPLVSGWPICDRRPLELSPWLSVPRSNRGREDARRHV